MQGIRIRAKVHSTSKLKSWCQLACSFVACAVGICAEEAQGPPNTLWQRGAFAGAPVAVAYSHDGTMLATGTAGEGSAELAIKIWRIADGQLLHSYFRQGAVLAVAFTPDDTSVIAADSAREIVRVAVKPYAATVVTNAISASFHAAAISLDASLVATDND